MQKLKLLFGFSSFFLCLVFQQSVFAGVVADRSRIVFNVSDREQGLSFINFNNYPVMVQIWVDDGAVNSGPDVANAPILPYPGLLQFMPKEQKRINLLNISEIAPKKQEQLYWLNIYEVPPRPTESIDERDGQLLVVAVRTQMKVFIRPNDLDINVNEIQKFQKFSIEGRTIKIENNTPYFVTYQDVVVSHKDIEHSIYHGMLSPYSVETVLAPNSDVMSPNTDIIKAFYVDDDGNVQQFLSRLN